MNFFGAGSEWFWQALQVGVVAATGGFLYVQLRMLNEQLKMQTKQLDLQIKQIQLDNDSHLVTSFDLLRSRWNSSLLVAAREHVCRNVQTGAYGIDLISAQVALFFEEVGAFCRRGSLNEEIVWEFYSFEIEHYWVILEDGINCYRLSVNDQTHYHHFRKLYDEILRMNKEKGAKPNRRTADEISSFRDHELKLLVLLKSLEPQLQKGHRIEGFAPTGM